MKFNRFVLAVVLLVACGPAFAHGGGCGHAGGAAVRPGGHPGGHAGQIPGQQHHMITPEMQQHMMMNQLIWGPLMYDIQMQDLRAAARRRSAQSNVARAQPQHHPAAMQMQRSMGASAPAPAANQVQPPAGKHKRARRRGEASGVVQASPPLVLAAQQPTEPEETAEDEVGSPNGTAQNQQSTELEQMSAADVTDGTAESKQAGDASSANGTEDDQQSAEPQLMNDADNPNGTGAANGGKGRAPVSASCGPNRLAVSELIQFAQDQGAIDLLKTVHARPVRSGRSLRRPPRPCAGAHRDGALAVVPLGDAPERRGQ